MTHLCHRMKLVLPGLLLGIATSAYGDEPLSFSRDVQPILSSRCYSCHGFDPNHRQADLRLDVDVSPDGSMAGHDVIAPGDPEGSSLLERVASDDPDLRMPPPAAGEGLKR